MQGKDWLAEQFEGNRGHLRAVAYRMLGSLNDADDAVQEAWLRLSRSGGEKIENLGGWLTTVVARVCLDALRSRQSRREEPLEGSESETAVRTARRTDPEAEALLADSVGFAMLVVLDRLKPAERVAFVLHDLFDLPFEDIARIAGRTPEATRQLASRARRRVRGVSAVPRPELTEQRALVDAFLAALRAGDAEKLVTLLDPEFAVHADAVVRPTLPEGIHGPEAWARVAMKTAAGARLARVALVDGGVGVVIAPRGKLFRVLRFTFVAGRIAALEVLGDPERLRQIDLAVLGE
ncbi:MAG TPA: sigma-70 family RNA polymerase sigma factor [Acidobacteriaceae bacterium]|nr:sigma-70 family RNA polymerase sigma factor [Acidobacteriaceae bacterium]